LDSTIIGLISLDTYLGERAAGPASPAVLLSNYLYLVQLGKKPPGVHGPSGGFA